MKFIDYTKDDPKFVGKALSAVPITPDPPRSLIPQSGSRKIILFWNAPEKKQDIAKWQVAKGTERNIVLTIDDPSIRRAEVAADSGASPPDTLLMVRAINSAKIPSQWAYITGKAIAEAGAPTDPAPPREYTEEPSGGGDDGSLRSILRNKYSNL